MQIAALPNAKHSLLLLKQRLFLLHSRQKLLQYASVPDGLRSLVEVWQQCLSAPANAAAWSEFLARVQPILIRIAWRVGSEWGVRTREEVDDLFQDICLKISQQARSQTARNQLGETEFLAYLKATAANAARDSLRARFAAKRGVRVTDPLENRMGEVIGQLGLTALDRQVLIREIECHLEDWPGRDQAIFWLYYRQGLTTNEIAAIPAFSLSSKGVESLLHRMTAALRIRLAPGAGDDSQKDTN